MQHVDTHTHTHTHIYQYGDAYRYTISIYNVTAVYHILVPIGITVPMRVVLADTAPSSTGLLTLPAFGPETGEEGAQGRRKVCGFCALGGEGKWLIQLNATR